MLDFLATILVGIMVTIIIGIPLMLGLAILKCAYLILSI